jgi:hypothetical protein
MKTIILVCLFYSTFSVTVFWCILFALGYFLKTSENVLISKTEIPLDEPKETGNETTE